MGDKKKGKKKAKFTNNEHADGMVVDTLGGRMHVEWDMQGSATPNGQLPFFAGFLNTTGVYQSWTNDCPLRFTSGNAHKVKDILGTWFLAILSGHRRYSHITSLRNDLVSAAALGMEKIVSEDALRRALARMSAEESENWLTPHLQNSVLPALNKPWILDIDTTIKTLFGKQEGAEVGYNPHKKGRPSHALHTYWVGNLRLVLDVEVCGGKSQGANKLKPGLLRILDQLPKVNQPYLVRGDCAFGNEPFIEELEARNQPYLFKMKQTPNVIKLLERKFRQANWQEPRKGDQGWSATEDMLQLQGWKIARRVVILRRELHQDVVITDNSPQQTLFVVNKKTATVWEYAVLVTNADLDLQAIAQLYRDRADCENGFDELKNQWGWGGFSTQDIDRCQTSARAVALIYNWWSWYCRAAKPDGRMEAITSRPLLLAGVARAVKHAGQTTLYLTPMHASKTKLITCITNIHKALDHVKKVAEQFKKTNRWKCLLEYISEQIIKASTNNRNKLLLEPTG